MLSYELGGRFGNDALNFFTKVSKSTSTSEGSSGAFRAYWTRRIATAAQKAYGELLRARLPQKVDRAYAPGQRAAPFAHTQDPPSRETIIGGGVGWAAP